MTSRNSSFHEYGLAGICLAPLKIFGVCVLLLLGLLLAAWIVDWIFVFKVWPDGLGQLQRILASDLERASRLQCGPGDVSRFAVATANFLYRWLFEATGVQEMGARFSDVASVSIPDTIARETYVSHYTSIHVAMVGTQLFGLRLAMIFTMTPLLALFYIIGLSDGLAQRAVRRTSGGRESGSLYHRAKHLQLVLIAASLAVSILFPASIDLRGVLLPVLAGMCILVRIQWTYYKKHL